MSYNIAKIAGKSYGWEVIRHFPELRMVIYRNSYNNYSIHKIDINHKRVYGGDYGYHSVFDAVSKITRSLNEKIMG